MSTSAEWQRVVVMRASVAGQWTAAAGETLALPLSLASAWVAAGLAEYVDGHETAATAPPERAMKRRGRPRLS